MKTLTEIAKDRLEVVLDEYFPKVEEEGPEKEAMKRGPALAIFAEAIMVVREVIKAFGGCEKCYGKGYGTETVFEVSKHSRVKMPSMTFCACSRGEQLKKLLETGEV